MAEDIGNLMEARMVAEEMGDVRALRDFENRINATLATDAGATLEVKHAKCSNLYKYSGMPHWTWTPGMAAKQWVEANLP